jgi:hypothetical protein
MTSQSDATHIYYNVRIKADLETRKHAVFSVNRVQPVLEKPEDYELAVVRFSLPTTSIPLIIFEDNKYSVSLKIGSNEYTEYLTWVSNSNVYSEKYVYNVQDIIDFMNTAWATAFSNLSGANVITSTVPPFMSFSSVTNLMTLHVPQSYLTDGIKVYANEELYLKINTFQDFYYETPTQGQLNYEFVIKDLFTNNVIYNTIPYYTSTQQFGTISAIQDLRTIQFITNNIPVNRELEGFQTNITSNLLTDFEPIQENTFDNGGLIQFYPQGPLRYIDLLSKTPLNTIDIKINWVSKTGNVYPYYLQGEQSATVKILFRKRQNITLTDFIDDRIEDRLEELKLV